MDFGSVGGCKERPDFIARPVELRRLTAGSTVEQIDEAPGHVFGIRFERCSREHDKHVGPDGSKGLLDCFLAWEIGRIERCRLDG